MEVLRRLVFASERREVLLRWFFGCVVVVWVVGKMVVLSKTMEGEEGWRWCWWGGFCGLHSIFFFSLSLLWPLAPPPTVRTLDPPSQSLLAVRSFFQLSHRPIEFFAFHCGSSHDENSASDFAFENSDPISPMAAKTAFLPTTAAARATGPIQHAGSGVGGDGSRYLLWSYGPLYMLACSARTVLHR
ncbi:hypothetical protein BZA05DRAFT_172861 [Tricharina praecox]|uniref:uncharacterized protein n=1 Tax=Tricharina praecox TaxID=43433 RepID=UPI00221FD444|nr:uncharacterized protein BZA05DRAFT_172861 [Tricharina praecox]KAI5844265.1 hypothetical protein BZA05DRAFT_172861 [Tricharina praecox]